MRIQLRKGGFYETRPFALAAWRAYLYCHTGYTFTLFISLDELHTFCARFRRQRIDVGAYENSLFPYARIRRDTIIFLQKLALLLANQRVGYTRWHTAHSRSFLYDKRQLWSNA